MSQFRGYGFTRCKIHDGVRVRDEEKGFEIRVGVEE
jgi:hypothetical protein